MHLIFNEEGLNRVIRSLDFYSRIWIGQYDQILWELRWIMDCDKLDTNDTELKSRLFSIRHNLLPELDSYGWNGSHGIYSPDIDFKAGVAYNMQQEFRYQLAYFNNPNGGITVDFNEPLWAELDPYERPRARCYKSDGETLINISVCYEQVEIINNAQSIYQALKDCDIRKIFSYYTDDEQILLQAQAISSILKGDENV